MVRVDVNFDQLYFVISAGVKTMEKISHEFTDAISEFLDANPSASYQDWLVQMQDNQLSRLRRDLQYAIEWDGVFGRPSDCFNIIADAHMLVFKVNNIGKKRLVSRMPPERQHKIMKKILGDVQLLLINRNLRA